MSADHAFPTHGVLTARDGLVLAWPEPGDYDAITALRNLPHVRRWFLDRTLLDAAQNRIWLETGMKRGEEGLLCIRWAANGALLGTIGWAGYDPARKTASFGRLVVDAKRAALLKASGAWKGDSIAVAAGCLLRDFVFAEMGLAEAATWHFANNRMAARVNSAIGMRRIGEGLRQASDGTMLPTVELRLTRSQWQDLLAPS